MNTNSYPGSNKATYNMDTTSYQNEFSHNIKHGEKHWQEERYDESIFCITQVSKKPKGQ